MAVSIEKRLAFLRPLCEAVAKARQEQRDAVGDSDLYDEQPIRLDVSMTLGDARAAAMETHSPPQDGAAPLPSPLERIANEVQARVAVEEGAPPSPAHAGEGALEPCPFCGDRLVVRENSAFHLPATVGKDWCWLSTAGEFGGPYELDRGDYAAWNRRPVSPLPAEAKIAGEEWRSARSGIGKETGVWIQEMHAAGDKLASVVEAQAGEIERLWAQKGLWDKGCEVAYHEQIKRAEAAEAARDAAVGVVDAACALAPKFSHAGWGDFEQSVSRDDPEGRRLHTAVAAYIAGRASSKEKAGG